MVVLGGASLLSCTSYASAGLMSQAALEQQLIGVCARCSHIQVHIDGDAVNMSRSHLHKCAVAARMQVADLLPKKLRHEAGNVVRGSDTMDVWFDSGSSWAGVTQRTEGLRYPADLYLEGSDQHRFAAPAHSRPRTCCAPVNCGRQSVGQRACTVLLCCCAVACAPARARSLSWSRLLWLLPAACMRAGADVRVHSLTPS